MKKTWIKPELKALEVDRTLTGSTLMDTEATFQGDDLFIGGPQS